MKKQEFSSAKNEAPAFRHGEGSQDFNINYLELTDTIVFIKSYSDNIGNWTMIAMHPWHGQPGIETLSRPISLDAIQELVTLGQNTTCVLIRVLNSVVDLFYVIFA